jgi:acetyltransferase-like isoleucine patch superfamily enzyme
MPFSTAINSMIAKFLANHWYKRKFTQIGSNLTLYRGWYVHPMIIGNVSAKNNLTLISWANPVVLDAEPGASIEIGNNVTFNHGVIITSRAKVTIGDDTFLGPMVRIMDSDGHGLDGLEEKQEPIVIGKNVLIGAHAMILKGVTIGDNSVVGAGAVVTRNVEANSIVAGNPARKIRATKGYTK